MTIGESLRIIETWTAVYASHLPLDSPQRSRVTGAHVPDYKPAKESSLDTRDLVYMQIFDNNGSVLGASNAHPHGQIWITSSMPDEPERELSQMKIYCEDNCGSQLLGDYVRLEMDREERVVWQNEGFLAVCPWWAVWPYEILLLPKRAVRSLVDLNGTEMFQFAEAMLQVNKIYDNLFGMTFPYISGLHQAPLNATGMELECSYLHMHFCPPLLLPSIKKFFGGYEFNGEPTREITPEAAASQLRCSSAHLSK
ncbi:putative Galactose-1-phosphate uridylyltransferase [Seiridium unicorne]|uniref:Galactose-1-phosphate uridylyltransferase n=1 Tax=Seiridium unicorne TaxID=138068 RepID=A0ABR2VAW5_9PEZI